MAYTYIGSLARGAQSDSSWNGMSWNQPVITFGTTYALGTRQGLDPLPTKSWDRRTFRANPVKIIRETGAVVPLVINKWKPIPNWGIDMSSETCLIPGISFINNPSLYWPESRASYVRQKVLAKLHASEFDLGTNLGEVKETLQMLRSPLKGIRDFLIGASRRKSESVRQYSKRLTDATSSTWLEYRYGIRPLISAVSDAVELYEKGFRQLYLDKLYRKKSRIILPKQGNSSYEDVYFSSFLGRRMVSTSVESFIVGKCYFKYTQLPTVYERLGLDLAALPGIAWELTSLSFVWDWFFGIGNWIESLRAEIGREILGTVVTYKVVHRLETQILPGTVYVKGQPSWRPVFNSNNGFVGKTEFMERRLYSDTVSGLPAFNPSSLDLLQTLDSLTLIWQKMPRRK